MLAVGVVWCVCVAVDAMKKRKVYFSYSQMLNPAEPSTAEMPLTLTPSGEIHSTLVHVLASRLGELQQAARTRDLLDLTMN